MKYRTLKRSKFTLAAGAALCMAGLSGVGYIPGKSEAFTVICTVFLISGALMLLGCAANKRSSGSRSREPKRAAAVKTARRSA